MICELGVGSVRGDTNRGGGFRFVKARTGAERRFPVCEGTNRGGGRHEPGRRLYNGQFEGNKSFAARHGQFAFDAVKEVAGIFYLQLGGLPYLLKQCGGYLYL